MRVMYCRDCQNYLMGADGECHDCCCGWKQERECEPCSTETQNLGMNENGLLSNEECLQIYRDAFENALNDEANGIESKAHEIAVMALQQEVIEAFKNAHNLN